MVVVPLLPQGALIRGQESAFGTVRFTLTNWPSNTSIASRTAGSDIATRKSSLRGRPAGAAGTTGRGGAGMLGGGLAARSFFFDAAGSIGIERDGGGAAVPEVRATP